MTTPVRWLAAVVLLALSAIRAVAYESPVIGNLSVFPPDNPWRRDVSGCPVHPNSDNYINAIGRANPLHPDFGTVWNDAPNGIPFVVVNREIEHTIRVTVRRTQRKYIYPARHFASALTDPNLPPMGLRLRLKASYDITRFPPAAQVILRALKKYGLIVADNGGSWFISGAPDSRWSDEELSTLKRVKGSDFEAVFTGERE